MEWIDHDNFEPLVDRIMGNPIGIQHAKASTFPTDTLLRNTAKVTRCLLLVDTAVDRLSVDDVTLLRLVPKPARFIWARWPRRPVDSWELAVLPSADTHEEPHDIGLLLTPELLHVLVCTHGYK